MADEEVTAEQLAELNQFDDTKAEAGEEPEGLPTDQDGSDPVEGDAEIDEEGDN